MKWLLMFTGLLVLILVILVGISAVFENRECNNLARAVPDQEFKYVVVAGCMVKTDNGEWLSTEYFAYTK